MPTKNKAGWTDLVIVESPAKSQTIKKFLGDKFEVKASFGHISDLPKKTLGVDIKNNFAPLYEISPDKKKVVADLKKDAKQAQRIWIATDEDREGEAIGRHIVRELGLDPKTTSRIVFHEITKTAIDHAVKNPRTIDMNLVDAQQARRVLDRLVGFEVSPILRRKIKPALSAGRVQSVAVRLIVEREREIQKFSSQNSFRVIGDFIGNAKKSFKAELIKRLTDEQKAKEFLEEAKISEFKISKIEVKPSKRSPSAPFTTSTLQQEASRKLGFSVARTMQVAQKLYEAGFITYMRTDSLNLSDTAIKAAAEEITKLYGKEYSKVSHYKSKSKGAQEAHECIRPTHMENRISGQDPSEQKLYDLIWKRTIASQMASAELEKTKATIDISKSKNKFMAQGEVIKFDGFLKVYAESTDDEDEEAGESLLPKLTEGEILDMQRIVAKEVFDKHPPRYTEASLVKKLEELGIGRPSTYAPTISTIQKRGYVVREDRQGEQRNYQILTLEKGAIKVDTETQTRGTEKAKLFPEDIGIIVNDFLVENFADILDYGFTASVEGEFDHVAEGKVKRYDMLKGFYTPFHEQVVKTGDNKEFVKYERSLGNDPKTGRAVIARMGKFGPLVQMGSKDAGDKVEFAPVRGNFNLETVTLEQALTLFQMPRHLGQHNEQEVTIGIGRFGPYVKYGTSFVSIKKDVGDDPYTITLERAIELIESRSEAEKNKNISSFDHDGKPIEVLNGRYGPYIKYDKKNFKIPKGTDAKTLDLQACKKIIGIKK